MSPRKRSADRQPTRNDIAGAQRAVDQMHAVAAQRPDPIQYMRDQLAEAETAWFRSGDMASLALVRALEASLNGPAETDR